MEVQSSLSHATLQALESLDLPTPPVAALAFLRAAARDDASIGELSELARREPTLTARILSVANSAAFHASGAVRTLAQSMQTLGMRNLHAIAAAIAVREAFSAWKGAREGDLDGFWRHALETALLAQSLAAETPDVSPEEAYMAGLLHDVGILLLLGCLGAPYGRLLASADDLESTLTEVERAELEADHGAAGAWLVERWKLPSFMADALLLHHRDAAFMATADGLSRVVWLAQACLAPDPEASDPDEDDGSRLPADIAALTALPSARLVHLRQVARDRTLELSAALGFRGGPGAGPLPRWRAAGPGAEEPARDGLRQIVGAMAALQPLQQDLAYSDNEAELLAQARESARVLFGVADVVFVLRPGESSEMAVVPLAGQGPQLSALRFTGQPQAPGVCNASARTGRTLSSFDTGPGTEPTAADLQLTRALGAEGLLCVPIWLAGSAQGVMVLPVSAVQHRRLSSRTGLLESFASTLAGHLRTWKRLRTRERLRTANAIERLRGRERQVVHEIGNPLAIIKSYLLVLRSRLPDTAVADEELQVLNEEIDRVARIAAQLGSAAAPAAAAPAPAEDKPLDLNRLVESLHGLYAAPLFEPAGVKSRLRLQKPLAAVRASEDAVRQVLLNLWKNAAEALPVGAQVTTSTGDHVHRGGRVFAQVVVTDTGPGLPEEVRASLFKPMQGDRRPGHAGLGLSIVHELVLRMGGHVDCQSAPGQGARFVVLLPQVAAAGTVRSPSR